MQATWILKKSVKSRDLAEVLAEEVEEELEDDEEYPVIYDGTAGCKLFVTPSRVQETECQCPNSSQ